MPIFTHLYSSPAMTPDFDAFCQYLATDNTQSTHPSEIHGLGCGYLAAGYRPDSENLFRQLSNYTGEKITINDGIMDFFNNALNTLESDSFEFQLCLPDDDIYSLPERAESLRVWCQGFIHAMATTQNAVSEEGQELLKDLTEISQLDASTLDNEEDENEGYYIELAEFVRMAVISLFMDHNPQAAKESSKKNHNHH